MIYSLLFSLILLAALLIVEYSKKLKICGYHTRILETANQVITLLVFCQIYENILYKQTPEFFNNIFSKYQTGFRKGFNSQCCLVVMLEKFRKCLDDGSEYAALLTDLLKAFDWLPLDLLIAKLHAYGFDTPYCIKTYT